MVGVGDNVALTVLLTLDLLQYILVAVGGETARDSLRFQILI